MVRGRGSTKEGRSSRAPGAGKGLVDTGDDEELHVMISADDDASLEKVGGWLWGLGVGGWGSGALGLVGAAALQTLGWTEQPSLRCIPCNQPPSDQRAADTK